MNSSRGWEEWKSTSHSGYQDLYNELARLKKQTNFSKTQTAAWFKNEDLPSPGQRKMREGIRSEDFTSSGDRLSPLSSILILRRWAIHLKLRNYICCVTPHFVMWLLERDRRFWLIGLGCPPFRVNGSSDPLKIDGAAPRHANDAKIPASLNIFGEVSSMGVFQRGKTAF